MGLAVICSYLLVLGFSVLAPEQHFPQQAPQAHAIANLRNLGWALGCSGGPVDHEGSLRGKTKANLNDRECDADQEATPAALFIWPIARSRSCFVRIRLRMR